MTADGAVAYCHCGVTSGDAAARGVTNVILNRAIAYRRCRTGSDDAAADGAVVTADDAVRNVHCSSTTIEDAAPTAGTMEASARPVAADNTVYHCQLRIARVDASTLGASAVTGNRAASYRQCRAVGAADAAALLVAATSSAVTEDAGAECEPSVVKDAAPSVVVAMWVKPFVIVKPEIVTFDREIFKHAESGVAVDRQIFSTRAVNRHVVGNLKFVAGQQDSAGHAGGVNRVAVICAWRARCATSRGHVIGVCDYDDASWQPVAAFDQSFVRAAKPHPHDATARQAVAHLAKAQCRQSRLECELSFEVSCLLFPFLVSWGRRVVWPSVTSRH